MKSAKFLNLFVTAMVLSIAVVGCKRNPYGVTPLPGQRTGKPGGDVPGGIATTPITPITATPTGNADGTIPPVNFKDIDSWPENRDVFKAYTVHFDFDSSAVKSSEKSKIEAVAEYLKANPGNGLKIEGHCDERGTEEYNRGLGDRRAMALREYLANLGSNHDLIITVSFGEDRPVAEGHDEAAYAKNRRGDFVLKTPPK